MTAPSINQEADWNLSYKIDPRESKFRVKYSQKLVHCQ